MSASRHDDPIPLAPRHGEAVEGSHITLEWEPPAGAERVRVQIAEDPAFTNPLVDEDLPAASRRLVLERGFPDEGRTFYWRALAGAASGWSPGDNMERFTSGPAEDAALPAQMHGGHEPLGPVPELFRVARLQASAELTPDRRPEAERAVGGKPEGLEGAEIVTVGMTFIIAAGVFLAVVIAILVASC